jgi:hypothetical protein
LPSSEICQAAGCPELGVHVACDSPLALHTHFCSSKPALLARCAACRFKSRAGGKQGAEARLETKSHRRVSRRSVKQSLSELSKGVEEDEADY